LPHCFAKRQLDRLSTLIQWLNSIILTVEVGKVSERGCIYFTAHIVPLDQKKNCNILFYFAPDFVNNFY
jgi:hypothetical protein